MLAALALDLLKDSRLRRGDLALASPTLSDQAPCPPEVLSLGWPELEGVLPDHGLPRGVVEIAAAQALGGCTQVALAAVRGAQGRSPGAWCAWVDPEGTLYAPGVAKTGVDLRRLLVVRPPRRDLGRIAVKLAQARAFEVLVVDYAPPALVQPGGAQGRRRALRPEVLVRKLALLADEGGGTVVLLTDTTEPRAMSWPVALRIELARAPGALTVKVVKDRFCRLGTARIAWPAHPAATR
jgi:recombination protein RecA